jgi:hypothetical protein
MVARFIPKFLRDLFDVPTPEVGKFLRWAADGTIENADAPGGAIPPGGVTLTGGEAAGRVTWEVPPEAGAGAIYLEASDNIQLYARQPGPGGSITFGARSEDGTVKAAFDYDYDPARDPTTDVVSVILAGRDSTLAVNQKGWFQFNGEQPPNRIAVPGVAVYSDPTGPDLHSAVLDFDDSGAPQLRMKSPDGTWYRLSPPNGGGAATWEPVV